MNTHLKVAIEEAEAAEVVAVEEVAVEEEAKELELLENPEKDKPAVAEVADNNS